MKKLLMLCVVLSLWMFGCGSETSGSLSVTAPSSSDGIVTATATFTPASGSALPGQHITFRWYTVVLGSSTQSPELSETKSTDNTGAATSQLTLPVGRTDTFTVYVIASTGGLVNKEGWQSVLVTP
jgi:hypothetical protein